MGMVSMNGLMGGHPMLGGMLAGDMGPMGLPAMSMAMPGDTHDARYPRCRWAAWQQQGAAATRLRACLEWRPGISSVML